MAWQEPPLKSSCACNPEILVYYRERRGWTQKQLCDLAGYSERLIGKAEAGQPIKTDTISDLADALSTPEDPVTPEGLICDPVSMAKEYVVALYTRGKDITAALRHFLDEEILLRIAGDPSQIPFAGEHRGIDAFRRAFEIFFSILEAPVDHDPLPYYRFVGAGKEVHMFGESWLHPIGQPMDKPMPVSHRFAFRRGKLVLLEDIFDTAAGERILMDAKAANKITLNNIVMSQRLVGE